MFRIILSSFSFFFYFLEFVRGEILCEVFLPFEEDYFYYFNDDDNFFLKL